MRIFHKIKKFVLSCLSVDKQAKIAGVKFGQNNQFFTPFWSSEPYLIEIGNNCQITAGVKFFTHGGAKVLRDEDPYFDFFGKIQIGDNVYIGNNALILPGVSIGNNVLVAAGSVVTHSIPSNVVVGGNPAKIICDIEFFKSKHTQFNTQTAKKTPNEKKKILLNLPNEMFVKKKNIL